MAAPVAAIETTAQVTERVLDKVMDKSGDFVNAAASAASNVFEAASNIVSTAVTKYGQQVVDAVLWVVRLDAIQTLVTSYMFLIFCLLFWRFVWTGFTKREWATRIHKASDGFLYAPLSLAGIIVGVVMWCAVAHVTDVWTYTAIAKPELYLAKQAVDIVRAKLTPPKAKQ